MYRALENIIIIIIISSIQFFQDGIFFLRGFSFLIYTNGACHE